MNEDSCIGINYAHMFPECFRSLHTMLGFALCFMSSIQLLSLYPFTQFWPVREFLVEIHTAKTGRLRCCLYTPSRLQQTAVSCKRSNCNKIENKKNKFVKVVRLRFYPKTEHNGFLRSVISLCMRPNLTTFFALLWTPPGTTPLPPTGRRTRWLVPLLILPEWHGPELSFFRFSMVQCFQTFWERSTNSVCIENILIPSRILIQTSSSRSCLNWEKVQCIFNETSIGHFLF